jgi:hypothetical protein
VAAGVLALAYRAEVRTDGVILNRQLDVVLPA